MPTRYRHQGLLEERTDTVTDVIGDNAQTQVREVLAPKIAKLSRNALNVTPVQFLFFQAMKSGRRCSCWGVVDDPNARCVICMGTGIVGAYQKYGTATYVFDSTAQNVRCINVAPDYLTPTRPIAYALVPTATFGYLETEIEIRQNINILDSLQIWARQSATSFVEVQIKSPTDADYLDLTEAVLAARLGFRKLSLRVVFRRVTPNDPIPALAGIRITYQVRPNTIIKVDIPRVAESKTLEDFGIFNSATSQSFFLDQTLKSITTEDFFYCVLDGTRWKIIEVKANELVGINTSWDLVCRLVQNYEPMQLCPVGKVPDPTQRPPRAIASEFAAVAGPEALLEAKSPFPLQIGGPGQHTPWRSDEAPAQHIQLGQPLADAAQSAVDSPKK